jgi:4-hydroxybenzoyl-CoA thioesterase/acyl-CoA thioester hydrolase
MVRISPIRATDLSSGVWKTRTTIRFGQCDPAGIVYTPVYFDLFNVAIEDWYPASLGIDYYALLRDEKVGVGYGHASADFLLASTMGDVLEIAIVVADIGKSSFTLTLHAFKDEDEAVRGELVVVTTSLVKQGAIPIPVALRQALEAYRDRCR